MKICLWIAGVGCLLSVFGMFLPVGLLESIAKIFGIESLPDSPLVMYAARLMSATYVAVGVFFIILARHPIDYGLMVPFAGIAAVFIGLVAAITGLTAGMPTLVVPGRFFEFSGIRRSHPRVLATGQVDIWHIGRYNVE